MSVHDRALAGYLVTIQDGIAIADIGFIELVLSIGLMKPQHDLLGAAKHDAGLVCMAAMLVANVAVEGFHVLVEAHPACSERAQSFICCTLCQEDWNLEAISYHSQSLFCQVTCVNIACLC